MARRVRLLESAGLSTWGEVRRNGRRMLSTGARSFAEHDLMSYASAVSFQVAFALIPLVLTGLALLGFLGLAEVWRSDLAPRVREAVEPDTFSVIDRGADQILGEKRGVWLTFGIVFALWQISGAVRATMTPLNLVYGSDEDRAWWHRFLVSLGLALAIGPLVVGAALLVQLGPRLLRSLTLPAAFELVLYVARWGVAVAFLIVAVWLLIRYATARPQPFPWAGLGSVFVVGAWIVASVAFGLYATRIADYQSVFGSLASIIVLLTYIYISSLALLFGIQLDACVRERVGASRTRKRPRSKQDHASALARR